MRLLRKTHLFAGIAEEAIEGLLGCVRAAKKTYRPGELILQEGEQVSSFGLVLSGAGRAVKEDREGRPVIITLLRPGSEIGVILAASRGHRSPVSVQAQESMTVLTIPFDAMMARCPKACGSHDRLLQNFIGIVAEKGLVLHERIDCLLKPTVREKVLAYLLRVSAEQESRCFSLPLDRAAMAEYLNVDRSALSRELSRKRADGLIEFSKNRFCLL